MIGFLRTAARHAKIAALLAVAVVTLAACGGSLFGSAEPQQAAAPPIPPPQAQPAQPQPPPVDLAGRWRLSAASGGACFMVFGAAAAGAAQGTIAPEGGCPAVFFTSRKWTFEQSLLVIRNHKGESLAQLSFAGGQFEGQTPNGGALTLSRQ
jgi:hypothetical protein